MSDTISIRLPDGLKAKLEKQAKEEFRTLNNYVAKALTEHAETALAAPKEPKSKEDSAK